MKGKKNDPSVFLLAAIVLLLAAGIIVAVYALRGDPVEEALSEDRVINVLYVIEKDRMPLSTYVLMYYPATKRAAVFDVPGDLGLLLRRINRVDRIDSVYSPGKIEGFADEVERLLGIDLIFSVVITVDNLGKMVDLIGGVELFIPAPVDIRGEAGPVRFSPGITRLDGDKAAVYVSYDAGEENRDVPVSRRQRFFLGLLRRQAEMNEVLKNPEMAKLYQSFLQTNMSQRTRARLSDEFVHINTDNLVEIKKRSQGEWYTGVQMVEGTLREVSGRMLLIPHWDGSLVKDIVRQTLGALTQLTEGSSDRVFTVEVLNGTAENGLAGRTAELLRGFGYDVVKTGNADHGNYEKTGIIDRTGDGEMAKLLAEKIRCQNIRSEPFIADSFDAAGSPALEDMSDFTLIIGRDFNGRYVTGN